MEQSEAKKILLKVGAIWTRQPTDDAVQAEWAESLSRVSFPGALEAVREFRDSGRPEPPTPGEVWKAAQDIDDRRAREQAARRLRLVEPAPSEAERARGRATLHEIIGRIGRR